MFDFYFGTQEEVKQDEIKFLISVKRMLPRWVNSIADSEFIALARLLDERGALLFEKQKFILVETGVGASTLLFIFYAIKYNGHAFSWDMSGEKGSFIRSVCTETIGSYFKKRIDDHWSLIQYNSLSPYLGLPILKELVKQVDFFFHDSDHTWKVVHEELEAICPLLCDGAIVALDDANKDYLHTNMAYVNTFRKKLGLCLLERSVENITEPFYIETEKFLKEYWINVEYLSDFYKKNYKTDPYFSYYNSEFDIKTNLGTERLEKLEHRFDSWRVSGRRNQS